MGLKGIVGPDGTIYHFDHEYLENNPPIPDIDNTLKEEGDGADAKATGDSISDLFVSDDARIQGIANGKILLPAIFVRGSHTNQSGGEYINSYTHRITTKTKVHFDTNVSFVIADGFQVRRYWFDNNGFVSFDGSWQTGTLNLSSSYSYYLNIARVTDDTTEVANIEYFASQVYQSFTDTTLSVAGKPADAAAVRQRTIIYRGEVTPSTYDNKLSKIFAPGAYLVSPSSFEDTPLNSSSNAFLLVFNVNTNFGTQILYGVSERNRQVYWRSVRSNGNAFTDWQTYNSIPARSILAIGDSICNGERNSNKGFVGDLGLPYTNAGVSGACLSTIRDDTTHWIENQLTGQGSTYNYDVILMEGGINDYIYSAPLGALSDKPVRINATDTSAYEALDTGTVIGALEHLFANCIYKYPDADRFFIISHKTRNYPWTAHFTGGYTQQQLHDAIVSACEMYNVRVIDVYKDSPINTYFKEYYSPTEWSNDHSVGDTEWVDNDQVHPLSFGYLHGYVPLIRDALMATSHK